MTANYRQIPDLIARRAEFKGNSARGAYATIGGVGYLGMLPDEHRPAFKAAWEAAGRDLYVVWSYATPVAWHVPGEGWTIPDEKYSTTTSRLQRIVRDEAGVRA